MIHTSAMPASSLPRVTAAITLLDGWITARSSDAACQWFRQQCQLIADDGQDSKLFKAMGMAARKLGKADLCLDAGELQRAGLLRTGFDPGNWSIDIAARVVFILIAYAGMHDDEQAFAALLDRLADSAEINELIALYCGFALYPATQSIEHRAREAIRSSMRPVFEAMAHRNPYPVEAFDEAAWNQMVVKTFFLDSPLWPVQAVDARANPALAVILVDLAYERWAAGRSISPELWRCVTPHADEYGVAALMQALDKSTRIEKLAIAKSLPASCNPISLAVYRRCEEMGLIAAATDFSWQQLYEKFVQRDV
ncbi:EboA domain-containing protein [Undibacterium sp. TS12]|uniref:EboA domain-containing protein n=1 Tax=Undibacterium sp. TS12 TaxID=2908202 RepID=UPI001F4C6266|nr:EboA domain-containing protein [Undibacterium sp. TS12]MCH8617571.1 EboA domain-containing protein [Undibacterium sp. TS12]